MSLRTGLSPDELLELSPEMYSAMEWASEHYWPEEREFLAAILERLDALLRVTINVNSKKGKGAKGAPLRIPRPGYTGSRNVSDEAVGFREYMNLLV